MEVAIVGGLIREVIASLGISAARQAARVLDVHNEIRRLEDKLGGIMTEIRDADQANWILAHSEATNRSLKKLIEIAYEAESIIDRFKIQMDMRGLPLQGTDQTIKSQMCCVKRILSKCQGWSASSVCRLCRDVSVRQNASNDINKLNRRLQVITAASEMRQLRQALAATGRDVPNSWVLNGPGHTQPNTIGSVIDNDCDDHIKRLSPGGQALLAIVGAPGVGKTTLARKIYHQMREQFVGNRIWVYDHSGPRNLAIWSGEETVTEKASTEGFLEMIHQRLAHSQKLLLVIDNVHGDIVGWSNFLAELRRGELCGGIRIVVTTSHSHVARDIRLGTGSCCHQVNALDEDDGWLLLRTEAKLQDQDDVGEIQDIGRRIVRKCSGIPLALQVVRSKLISRVREKQWRKELRIFSLDKERYAGVRTSIDASYMKLEYRLKRCFLYCSLYPQGSVIEQHHIVQQWVAEGFFVRSVEGTEIEPQQPEAVARGCYKELLKRNLLLPAVNGADCTLQDGATMPALWRSYAMHRSKDENRVDARHIGRASFKVWRLCVSDADAVKNIPAGHARNLRTLILLGTSTPHTTPSPPDMDVICEKFTNLRVLDLRDTQVTAIRSNLKKLLQLRYLNLSNTRITTLPPEVGNLAALQFFTVKNCQLLTSLPEEVGRLASLRSLDISGTPALMDLQFRLANLEQLNCFRGFLPVGVGSGGSQGSSSPGWTFTELSTLSKLTSLQILNLGSITQTLEADQLMLHNKTQLKELELDCNPVRRLSDGGDAETVDRLCNILDSLMPHRDLDTLKLANFVGPRLPCWVSHTHLHELQRLSIDGSYQCEQLPPLGMMEHLKFLAITGSNTTLFHIKNDLRGGPRDGKVAFPSLEQLIVAGMEKLEAWSGLEVTDMPLLRSFSLSQCHKLKSLPTWLQHCIALTSLKVQNCKELHEIDSLHTLKELQVETCHRLKMIRNLTRLENLTITDCSRLSTVQGVPLLRSMCLVERQEVVDVDLQKWLLKLMRRMQEQQQLRLRKLEIMGSEGLLDQCSTGLAPYGLIIPKSADFVHAKLHDGSIYFSYNRNTRRFWRSSRCMERACMYGMQSTMAIVTQLIQGVITLLGSVASNRNAQDRGAKVEMEFGDSLRSITLDTIDAIQLQADWTIARSEATNGDLKTLANIAYEAENIIDRFKIVGMPETLPFQELNERLEHVRLSSGSLNQFLQAMATSHEAGQGCCPIGPSHDDFNLIGSVTNDCNDHIRRLQSQSGNEALFAIVGAPGVGKTALAQKIYHQMQGQFTTRLWVHVPSDSGNLTIWSDEDKVIAGMEMITRQLAGSNLLLVMDNLRRDWTEWKFTEEQQQGFYNRGIRILVTTTHSDVASKIGVNMQSCCHRVGALDEDDGWLLLRMAGSIEEKDGHDGNIQQDAWRRIVRECSGIPMALKVVASYKSSKNREIQGDSEDDTCSIINYSEIRRSIDDSYMELGSRLKRCFLYCSLYPEGSVIEQHHIVQQWIAEGFFEHRDHQEEEARKCYTELLDRSLLLPAVSGANGVMGGGVVMPALLRSYAIDQSKGENYINDLQGVELKALRLCLTDGNTITDIPEEVRSLRTLMVIGTNLATPLFLPLMEVICEKFTSLRVLDLRDTQVVTIGGNLRRLLQLRYLNLSNTWIIRLPPEVGNLVMLEFLTVKGCEFLTSLPEEVGHLTRLRSLDISGTPALKDIRFGLTNLEQLNCFRGFRPVAGGGCSGGSQGTSYGWTCTELSTLSKLTSLQILNLGRIRQKLEADQLMLQGKSHLQELELDCTDAGDDDGLGAILDSLKPHEELASLKLTSPILPSWLSHTHLSRPSMAATNVSRCHTWA